MSEVKEHPILFSGEMVRAILDGRKTMTRRVVKPQPTFVYAQDGYGPLMQIHGKGVFFEGDPNGTCPHGQIGDRLWVRETLAIDNTYQDENLVCSTLYRADINAEGYDRSGTWKGGLRWTPSIHMPRWASRITLEIKDVRVQRLQDISEKDAIAEGIRKSSDGMWCGTPQNKHNFPRQHNTAFKAFADLWNSIHGTWDANPWVWVVEFRRVEV